MADFRFSLGFLVFVGASTPACGNTVIYPGHSSSSSASGNPGTGGSGGSTTTGGEDACNVDGPCTHTGDTCDLGCAGVASCYQGTWQQIEGTDGDPAKCGGLDGSASSSTGGLGGCSLVGTWDGVSGVDGTNPSTSASYVFNADSTWEGGEYQQDPNATKFMYGTFGVSGDVYASHNGDTFTILQGVNMGPSCASSATATYEISFSPDCSTMELLTTSDDCTGARLYLSASQDGTTLTRRP